MTRWQKERLAEQLKFFGAKKKRFISCYAKKPRILCKVKVKKSISKDNITEIDYIKSKSAYLDRQMPALYRDQLNRGMQNSAFGFDAMARAQMNMSEQLGLGQLGAAAQIGLTGGLGGPCGMGGYGATRQ